MGEYLGLLVLASRPSRHKSSDSGSKGLIKVFLLLLYQSEVYILNFTCLLYFVKYILYFYSEELLSHVLQSIDVQSLTRILVGLVKCGAWGCFDEFNRLEEATLSAISMQIHPIQEALRNSTPAVKLLDQEVSSHIARWHSHTELFSLSVWFVLKPFVTQKSFHWHP